MPQERTIKFLASPIRGPVAALAGVAALILAGSFAIGLREGVEHNTSEAREAVGGMLAQLAASRARELKAQTFWTEAYVKSREHDKAWLDNNYGQYLQNLLGYEQIYVLDQNDRGVYAFSSAGAEATQPFASVQPEVSDLISAIRNPDPKNDGRYSVVETPLSFANGQTTIHRTTADLRRVENRPVVVVASTIVPDNEQPEGISARPSILVAIKSLSNAEISDLGSRLGFDTLTWTKKLDALDTSLIYTALDGSTVGVLTWSHERDTMIFARRMAIGLLAAMAPLLALAIFLIRRSEQAAVILRANASALSRTNQSLERRVSERTHQLEAMLENIEQGIVMLGPSGEVIVANERAKDLLDVHTETDLALALAGTAPNVPPQDEERSGAARIDVIVPNGRIVEVRRRQLRENRSVIMLSDVSTLKKRQSELEAAISAANAASETKTRFLSTMSHEMRTPLNGVIGALEILRHTKLDGEQIEAVDIAMESSDALLVHINDVLDFSKMEAGHLRLVAKPFNLKRLVKSVIDIVAPQATPRDNRLYSEFIGNLPSHLVGDAMRVRQVLLNLVSNANKFTRTGSVTIKVTRCGGTAEHPAVKVEVVDTGIGIPKDRLHDLFHEFSMLDSSYTRRNAGTGLGLAISKRLIEAMGGNVGVDSVEGIGSTFWFEVSLASHIEAIAEEPETAIVGSAPKRHILLVDDNATNRLVASRMLMAAGHTVETATNGLEALAAVGNTRFDAVLMDISMPEMDGLEATRRIRTLDEPYRSTPIVALTANAIAGDRETFLAAGMDDYLTKPLRRADIDALLAGLPDRAVEATGPEAATAIHSTGEATPLLMDLSQLATLEGETSPDIVRSVVAAYIDEMHERLDQALAAMRAADTRNLQITSHAIAGASASVGAQSLQDLAREIEVVCHAQQVDAAFTLAERLPTLIEATNAAFSAYLEQKPTAVEAA